MGLSQPLRPALGPPTQGKRRAQRQIGRKKRKRGEVKSCDLIAVLCISDTVNTVQSLCPVMLKCGFPHHNHILTYRGKSRTTDSADGFNLNIFMHVMCPVIRFS